jgi:low temperature requirement protein LtrA
MLVLGVLWWSWTGYAWLTSVVDPEEGAVRIAMFAAMAGLLIVAICVPEAFDSLALEFALAYGVVRAGHIALFMLASRDDPALRHSTVGLAGGTAVGVGLLISASLFDGLAQAAVWSLALLLDMAEPFFFGSAGWKLVPGHFAERHGLVIIIALGESIVSLGLGASSLDLGAGVIAGALLGIAVAGAMWWAYFDVVAIVAERRFRSADPAEQVRIARDSYTYLHLPMIAGIIVFAVGAKETLHDFGGELATVPAVTLCGGVALYLVALSTLKRRNIGSFNVPRLVAAAVLVALIPIATQIPALLALGFVAVVACGLIVFEVFHYSEARERVRHGT